MPDKQARRAARETVAVYHPDRLDELLTHVADGVDRYRTGDLDAFDVDGILFRYSRAAKELWKFCNLGQPEVTAFLISEEPPVDWWERAAPNRP